MSYSRALCRLVFCTSVRRRLFSVSAAIDIVALFTRIILVLVSTKCSVFICDSEFNFDVFVSSGDLTLAVGECNSGCYNAYLLMHFRSMARVRWRYFPISLSC